MLGIGVAVEVNRGAFVSFAGSTVVEGIEVEGEQATKNITNTETTKGFRIVHSLAA